MPNWNKSYFPMPNPFFPKPKRLGLGSPVLVHVLLFPVMPTLITLIFVLADARGSDISAFVFSILFIALSINYGMNAGKRRRLWTKGLIVPCVVVAPASGPPLHPLIVLAICVMAPGPLGMMIAPQLNAVNNMRVRFISGGGSWECYTPAGLSWRKLKPGDIIWAVESWQSEVIILNTVAPTEFRETEVPEVAREWLLNRIDTQDIDQHLAVAENMRLQAELDTEYRQAAKANSKT